MMMMDQQLTWRMKGVDIDNQFSVWNGRIAEHLEVNVTLNVSLSTALDDTSVMSTCLPSAR